MLFSVVCLLVSLHVCYGDLYCLTCSEVVSPRHCKSIRRCNEGQVCFTEKYKSITGETLYNVGCQSSRRCESRRVNPLLQRLTSSKRYVYDPDTTECIECCSTDACNRDGCGSPDYPDIRGPACFDCQQTRDPRLCRSVAVCMEGEVCQTHLRTTFSDKIYTLACAPDFVCSQQYMKADICNQCCKIDFCNKNLCDPLEEDNGFQAVLDRDESSGLLVFRSVVTNVGQGYDPLTGIFRPRTNGTFVFTWNLESYGQSAVAALEVNSDEITTTQTQMSIDSYYSGSSFAILNLSPGDNVYLRLLNGTVNKTFTMFNGWKQHSNKMPAFYAVPSRNGSHITEIITNNEVNVSLYWLSVKSGFYLQMQTYRGIMSYIGYPDWINNTTYYDINMYDTSSGLVLISDSEDYVPCDHIEKNNMRAITLSFEKFSNPSMMRCSDIMINLDRSTTGMERFKIKKGGLFVFNIYVYTYGEEIVSSLKVNGAEVLQMSVHQYGYQRMLPVLQLQSNDEVVFQNKSGSFTWGSIVGWMISDV